MKDNLKDILNQLSTKVDQETLLLYLEGKLSDEKQHEIEKQIMDSDFDSDAFEGLLKMKDRNKLPFLLAQLNSDLKKKTRKKKAFRDKLQLKNEFWLLLSILIILLLIIISFFVIYRQL